MSHTMPIEVFPPGEFIREELEERGWTQDVLAEILGRSPRLVNEIISAKRAITPETAMALADAFGTSAQLWLNLESSYRLSQLRRSDSKVERRSKIYSQAPVREMVRRGWIGSSADLDVLERNVCAFLGIDTIDDDPPIVPHAARKSTSYSEVTAAQRAWLIRAVALASMVEAEPFTERRLGRAYERLRGLLRSPEHVARVPGVLADGGVRLVVVEHLPQTRIDGAAFWIGAKSPVVALSLRYDRIDCFWHTLMHDLAHIKNGDVLWTDSSDSLLLDSDLVGSHRESGNDRPKCEERADREAAGFLVSQPSLDAFICEVRPRYSKARIASFAKAEGVHPGLVVGQLQHRGEISFAHSRDALVKVRDRITSATITDGWGNFVAVSR